MSARVSCTACARKHIAQAMVLSLEAEKGYPNHAWLAMGHWAEAEDELLDQYATISELLRSHRVAYQQTVVNRVKHYSLPGFEMIDLLAGFDVLMPDDVDVTIEQPPEGGGGS